MKYLACFLALGLAASAQPRDERAVQQKVQDLLKQMTTAEKAGQLSQYFFLAFENPKTLEDRARAGMVGSFLFVTDPAQVNRLQKAAVEGSRLKIPILFGYDVIHGFKTIFPAPIGMAATWDPAMVEKSHAMAAREAAAHGIHWTFAPMVDIARDARWGRMAEGAGEDPYLGSAMAAAQVRGFQGPYIGSPEHIMACVKHFAAYGAAEGGRDYDAAYVPDVLLHNVYLKPFHAAVQAGAASLMSAYQDLNDVPATANPFLLQEVLRGDWAFKGFVVSDAFSVRDLTVHGFTRDAADATLRALTAGVDMDMGAGLYAAHIEKLVADKKLPVSVLDTAVARILAAKARMGLFEKPYVDESLAAKVSLTPEHRRTAREAAQRAAVLLRNQNGVLPLKRDAVKSLAVIGTLADSQADIVGSWAMSGDSKQAVTILQGLRNKLGAAARVDFAPGVQLKRTIPSMFDMFFPPPKVEPWDEARANQEIDKAVALARGADAAVLVLGEMQSMSGEAASRVSMDLPGRQQELLEKVVATGKPAVLVLMSARPLNLSWAAEHAPAILHVWYPGMEGGNAVADLLFGDAVPGGKLPVSWARTTGQGPLYYNHNLTHQPESGQGFQSRYWDEKSTPLYRFGYGLSYTTFAYSNLKLSRTEARTTESVTVSVDVKNTGAVAGDEVVQLYIHQQAGLASRPVRELKGFQRVTLKPGESRTVTFPLGPNELQYWNGQVKKWIVEAETFDIWAGGDSTATLHATLKLTN